ncbi:uncharacterized protein LOC126204140 [Schistocerca nitens]|uniref:uncharacterized protein LOC126204140 n=1 Tax=Schistocerca nitens TaxID=7011 RepID=UPI0021182785|nr:uncharacterized protein LOC126204140 [Schistocerca nitens]
MLLQQNLNEWWRFMYLCKKRELTPSLGECLRVLCHELCADGLVTSDIPDAVCSSIDNASQHFPDPAEVDPWRRCHNRLLSCAAHSYHHSESASNPRYYHLESWEESYHGSQESLVPTS